MLQTNMISRLLSTSLFLCYTLFCLNSIEFVATTTATAKFVKSFTNETDRRALLAIKDLIPVDPFRVFSSWNGSVHFCNWHGVTCSRRHQRVAVLNLTSLKVVGSLSPHIGNLTFLREIILHNNAFHGTIPQEIGRLFRLQNLYLSNNSFQGELPTNLTRCSELRAIDVYGNNLGGNIPTELGSLAKLVELTLSTNDFSGTIPPSLGNLSALRILSLSLNNLEGSVPFEFGQLSNLEMFQLSFNNLSGMVPTPLYNISSIHFFSIADNRLHGHLPPDLGLTLPNLQRLYVGGNQFLGPIPATIGNASGLAHFDTYGNALTGPVPKNLGNLQHLQLLNLAYNPLGTNDTNEFSFLTSLTNCTNLRILSLDGDHFSGALPDSIANLSTKLYILSLNTNFVSGSIPPGIGNLANLEYLGFFENSITGSIPNSIGKLSKLQLFFIYTNKISGKIPSSVGNMTLLTQLSVRGNMLQGSIPVSLGYCRNLRTLDLSDNELTGAIPEQVFALASLLTVFLDHNYLTGPLPSQVGELKNLEELDLSNNTLSGEIPSTLGNCLTLEGLDMANNFFEGTIPSSFIQLRGIQVLDLSVNNLSGQIPAFLGNFPFIWYLNLSFNYFEGEVPNEGIFRNTSAFSASGYNKLCGGIEELRLPACPSKVSKKQGKPLSRQRVIIIVTSVVLFIILLLASIFAILYRKRSSKSMPSLSSPLDNMFPQLSYAELLQATNEFSPANLIGEGRHSSVYKGILGSDEQIVAVKVLKIQERGANKSFLAECEALKNIRHRNLVKIITSCSSIDFKGNDFKALVYEFMPNGSLERWLHPRSTDELQDLRRLNLVQRLNIAIDVASALHYLHHHCETPVVHCDLKPSNILLDNDFTSHVGDFGLVRFLLGTTGNSIHAQTSSTAIRGTVGYVAPEYGMGSETSTHGDVYSYGILLMEMFTSKRPTDNMFTDNFSLYNFVKMALPDRVIEIVDPLLIEEEENESNRTSQSRSSNRKIEECLASILRIGVLCSADLPRERMNMKDVLMELHVIRNVIP